jgi:uncharacterized lipoprotein NlpE involved in copper resistance
MISPAGVGLHAKLETHITVCSSSLNYLHYPHEEPRPMRTTKLIGGLGVALLTACSSDGTLPSSTNVLNSDVAVVAGDAAAQDVEVMRGPSIGRWGLGFLHRAGRFDCDMMRGPKALTVTRTCTYKDAAGATQTAYDATTTASVTMVAAIKGSVEREKWSGTVDRTSTLTVSGLAGAETQATWNGNSSGTATKVRVAEDGTTRSYEMSHTGTITNVVVPVPATPTGWPLSGTITKNVTVKKSDGTTTTHNVSITFNGTNIVPITVNGETMDFDLSERHRPHRKR